MAPAMTIILMSKVTYSARAGMADQLWGNIDTQIKKKNLDNKPLNVL
jgi:hypothetical protein